MRKTEEDQGTRLVRAMTNILLGGVVALAVCLMFLFLCSIGISGGWLQEGLMYQMAVVSCVIGGFAGAMKALSDAGISVEYMYAFISRDEGRACVILRVENNEAAVRALQAGNVEILSEDKVYSL